MANTIESIYSYIKRDKRLIVTSLLIGISATVIAALASAGYADEMQSGIAGEIIRFHVLANSDADEDQALKYLVRDGVIEAAGSLLSDAENLSEARQILAGNLQILENRAQSIVDENGYDYSVAASITSTAFPTRIYGGAAFPAGTYEALKIVIGEGEGKNWWCVMFPPLCFVDITQAVLPESSKNDLKSALTEDEYNLVINSSESGELPFTVRFKVIEWWQKLKNTFMLYDNSQNQHHYVC